jgi:nucleoside 2-deoxyribosyltransferase
MAHPFGDRLRLREEEKRIEAATGLNLVNPFYDVKGRLDIAQFDKLAKDRTFKDRDERQKWIASWGLKPSIPKEVVERDLKAIRGADGVLAFFTDKISVGTPMEVFYASRVLHRPVYLIIEDRSKMGHPWLVYYATAIYTTVDEFITSINMARQ